MNVGNITNGSGRQPTERQLVAGRWPCPRLISELDDVPASGRATNGSGRQFTERQLVAGRWPCHLAVVLLVVFASGPFPAAADATAGSTRLGGSLALPIADAGLPRLGSRVLPVVSDLVAPRGALDPAAWSPNEGPRHVMGRLARVMLLRDYNTRVVLAGSMLLGFSAAVVGVFMLLRKRALIGDVVGHATLPGIAIAFLIMESLQRGSGRWTPGLMAGALGAGVCGVLATVAVRRWTRLKEDAALAITLGIFFGLGIALLTVIQDLPVAGQAGLHEFIYGKPASLLASDVLWIGGGAVLVLVVCLVFFKEFGLLCFDEGFAAARGLPVLGLDVLLMALVVAVSVVGLQSVGLLLVVALLIIPAAAARFWTDRLNWMVVFSGAIGTLSSGLGVLISAAVPRLPAGAIIVLVGSACFCVSLLFGTRRGVVRRMVQHAQLKRHVGTHDLMRAFYEQIESSLAGPEATTIERLTQQPVSYQQLLHRRGWSSGRLRRLLGRAVRDDLIRLDSEGHYRLTQRGAREACRMVRNHRLWELYLIRYADIAPSHVDRDADRIEHVLDAELLAELNQLLARQSPQLTIPPNPHESRRSAKRGGGAP